MIELGTLTRSRSSACLSCAYSTIRSEDIGTRLLFSSSDSSWSMICKIAMMHLPLIVMDQFVLVRQEYLGAEP